MHAPCTGDQYTHTLIHPCMHRVQVTNTLIHSYTHTLIPCTGDHADSACGGRSCGFGRPY
jgi:hypothetical protein